jgi:hypothetical protein
MTKKYQAQMLRLHLSMTIPVFVILNEVKNLVYKCGAQMLRLRLSMTNTVMPDVMILHSRGKVRGLNLLASPAAKILFVFETTPNLVRRNKQRAMCLD